MGWWRRTPASPPTEAPGTDARTPFRDRETAGRVLAARLGASALSVADAQRPLAEDSVPVSSSWASPVVA